MHSVMQTGHDDHDPEYAVTDGGTVYYVTCDDSGDDDCQCSVAD